MLINRLRFVAKQRGLWGGSSPWAAVWMTLVFARWMRKAMRREEEVVLREELKPGEVLEIRHLPNA